MDKSAAHRNPDLLTKHLAFAIHGDKPHRVWMGQRDGVEIEDDVASRIKRETFTGRKHQTACLRYPFEDFIGLIGVQRFRRLPRQSERDRLVGGVPLPGPRQ
jgi:hypothetical protein